MFENFYILLALLKDIFLEYKILRLSSSFRLFKTVVLLQAGIYCLVQKFIFLIVFSLKLMCFILLWLLLTSYFAFLFQKFYYDVSRRGLFMFILLGFRIASWIYELISFFRFGNMFCHYLCNYYFCHAFSFLPF